MSNSPSKNRQPAPPPASARRPPSLASRRLSAYITHSLDRRWERYARELRACQTGFSEASVHDLRVSIRRMISILDMAAAVVPDTGARRVRRDLKRLLDRFGPLRDVQVQLLLVGEMLPAHPQLGGIRTVLLVKERQLIAGLARRMQKVGSAGHAPFIHLLREKVGEAFYDSSRARARRAAVIATATAAFANAVHRKEMADRSHPVTIHRFRVAFKKFRYRAETLQPLLSWLLKEQLSAMNAYQTRLGEIQDVDLFLNVVRDYAARHRRPGTPAMRPVILGLLQRRRELIRAFFSSSAELYTYWHVSVNAPHAAFDTTRRRGA